MATETTATDQSAPYWTHAHLAVVLPFKRTRRYEILRESDFPAPLQLTPGSDPMWVADEARAWLTSRPRVAWDAPKPRRAQAPSDGQGELDFQAAPARRRRSA